MVTPLPTEEDIFHNAYDIVRHCSVVHQPITGLSDDFPLAIFDEKEKDFIIEQYSSAAYIYYIMTQLGAKEQGKNLMNFTLRRPQVMAILARNKAKNHLLKTINQIRDEVDEAIEVEQQKVKKKKPKKRQSIDEDEEGEDLW